MLQGVNRPVCHISDMIDCDCQGSQLGVSLCRGSECRITRALGNLGWLCAPGSLIKDLAGDISIFNERAGPRAGAGCWIAFIGTTQSRDSRVAARRTALEAACRKPDRKCRYLNSHHSLPLQTVCLFLTHLQNSRHLSDLSERGG